MPSPFPGMDPFLELPVFFGGLPGSMIAYRREFLQPLLPESYYAEIEDRVWVEMSQRYLQPDVNVLRSPTVPVPEASGGVAVASLKGTKPVIVHVPWEERRETSLQIFTRLKDRERLVTSIEVLSLANKTPGEQGRVLYLRKQREMMDGDIQLVEIDLLRAGVHTTAVPLAHAIEQAGNFDYHVCVHRFERREDYFVYPILLADRLPSIDVPLLPEHEPVAVDLQAVFDRCYDTGPYRRRLRYAETVLTPPLSPEQTTWAMERLRATDLLA